jgi:hypothetical protein
VIVEPLLAGVVKLIVAWLSPRRTEVMDGALGTVAGVTGVVLVAEGELVPTAFVAVTEKVYGVPFKRLVKIVDVALVVALCPSLA